MKVAVLYHSDIMILFPDDICSAFPVRIKLFCIVNLMLD